MQALLDAWVVGSPARPQSSGGSGRRQPSERTPQHASSESWASDDRPQPTTWLERLGESTLVKDTWLARNVVKPLSESGSGSTSSTDVSGSRTVRASLSSANMRLGEAATRDAGRDRFDRPLSSAPTLHGVRSGSQTERQANYGEHGSTAVPSRGGRDLVEHLRNLETSLRDPRDRDNHYLSHDKQWPKDRKKEKLDRERQQTNGRDGRHGRANSPLQKSSSVEAVLASRLASPRNVHNKGERSPYLQGLASPRGLPSRHASTPSRAGLLASPRAPPGSGGNILAASREGGALLGYNQYHHDSDDTSSESEPDQPSVDEIDVSTLSFVSNGERVWRAPDGVFSKRRQGCDEDSLLMSPRYALPRGGGTEPGNRNSEVMCSSGSRRSSPGPDIPRLNFRDLGESSGPAKQHPEPRTSPGRGSSRATTPSGGGSPVTKDFTLSPLLHTMSKDPGRTQSHSVGSEFASPRGLAHNQQALLRMYESLKADYEALNAHHKSTSEQNDSLRVSVLALERTLGSKRAETDAAISSGRPSSGSGSMGGWLTSRGEMQHGTKCPSCTSHQREVEAVRLELARERTRRRGLEQEKEKLEAMLIQATRASGSAGGGMLIDLGDTSTPRGSLKSQEERGGKGSLGGLKPRGDGKGSTPLSSPRSLLGGREAAAKSPRTLSNWT